MIIGRQKGISKALPCLQTKQELNLVEALLSFSWRNLVIPTNNTQGEQAEESGDWLTVG